MSSLNPLVSVVTPFYNEGRFLEEAINSVISQTYGHWELILIDDGAPDDTREIAKRFAAAYPDQIFYHHHENRSNRGVCVSRNLGIDNARGEFVAYLDADDVWLPDKLSRQLALFNEHSEATVLIEASRYWYSWDNPDRADNVIEVGAQQHNLYSPPELLIELYPLGKGAAPCPSGIMVRKKIHDHIRFVEGFVGDTAVYEDQAFLVQIYSREKVYVSPEVNNLYRQRVASQVYRVHHEGRYHRVRHYFLNWFSDYLKRTGSKDRRVWTLLRKALFRYRYPFLFRIRVLLSKFRRRLKKR